MKIKVPVLGTIGKAVSIDPSATNGATLETNLYMKDGITLATADLLRTYLGIVSGSGGTTAHRLLTGLTVGNDHPQYTRRDTLTNRGDLYRRGAAAIERVALGTAGNVLTSDGTDAVWRAARYERIASFVNKSGPVLVPVNSPSVRIPQASTVRKVTILTEGGTGACVIDIRKKAYASFPAAGGDSICAATKPTVSSGIKYEDGTLTGWTTSIGAGDTLAFVLESNATFTGIFLTLELEVTQ